MNQAHSDSNDAKNNALEFEEANSNTKAKQAIPLTSSAQFAHIVPGDSTVEVIGYVDGIESPRIVGQKNYKIFKFFINNGAGDRVQIVAWNNDVTKIEGLVKSNAIIHLDGMYCKPCVNPNFNKGSVPYELIVQTSTEIEILSVYDISSQIESFNPEVVEIKDISNQTQLIKIQGYIKTNFKMIEKQTTGTGFTCGSVTDGEYKIEVRILESIEKNNYKKGEHIEVIGHVQNNANPIHFVVKSHERIQKIDEKRMNLINMLNGTKQVVKRPNTTETEGTKKHKTT